ncbi:DUF3574 domain-containing protein [Acidisphaera sp. S103]|uniref:DUF3574 domain-containing protein n=1 Tax=Acidisphaera sp. S103 TaxID=1747223 RepID=UPI00131AE1C9|nr:DUF3574 domain-containing protein [Acidisphaera sp. S103]
MSRFITAACLIASLGGCAAQTNLSCGPASPMAIFTLYLGESIPGRDDLTDQEWRAFLDTIVTDNLPNGYTVFDANGGWMNPITHATVQEHTKVLLVALPEMPDSLAAINRIRTAYQTRYRQQLVGMTVEHACGVF